MAITAIYTVGDYQTQIQNINLDRYISKILEEHQQKQNKSLKCPQSSLGIMTATLITAIYTVMITKESKWPLIKSNKQKD